MQSYVLQLTRKDAFDYEHDIETLDELALLEGRILSELPQTERDLPRIRAARSMLRANQQIYRLLGEFLLEACSGTDQNKKEIRSLTAGYKILANDASVIVSPRPLRKGH